MIQSIVLPGRFPTTFYAYPEFTLLNREIRDEVRFENLNLLFWEYLLSADFLRFLRRHAGPESSRNIGFLSAVIDSGCLAALRDRKRFYDPERYLAALSGLGGYLAVASGLLRRFSGGNVQGLSIYGVDYGTGRPPGETVAYAGSDRSPVMDFYRRRRETIREIFEADIVSAVTYGYADILHLGALCVRFRRPGATVLVHGHSWENNSVDFLIEPGGPYADVLRPIDGIVMAEEGLAGTFNRIVESGTTEGVPNLHRFGGGAASGGSRRIREGSILDDLDFDRLRREADRQRPMIFSPEPVALHRFSSRGCTWNRCTFCRHNSRHPGRGGEGDREPEDPGRWPERLRRISEVSPVIVFCDQGIDPEDAATMAEMAADAGIAAKWSLRTRIDDRWDARRIATMAGGGCIELILGLESLNDRTLRRMNKTPLAGEAYRRLAKRIHLDSAAAGLWNHYCMIYGYPGETFEECRRTLKFLTGLIRGAPKTTFSLNRFRLLFRSDIYNAPADYGIRSVAGAQFLSNAFGYDEPNSRRSIKRVESGLNGFYRALGYREDIVADGMLLEMVSAFVNDSGHAPLLKAGHRGNPFMT